VAVSVAGVFIETHPEPGKAPSDGPCMVPLAEMGALLDTLLDIDRVAKAQPVALAWPQPEDPR
jgi:2-dehydro-3-deoxyphosphooctonate aldolase (KDO 8-P synthase)